MGEVYLVLEIQYNENGTVSNIVTSHTTIEDAEWKFHTVAAAAAISSVHRHSVVLMDSQGFKVERTSFDHFVDESDS